MKTYFVTGIGTGVGKTIVAAALTEALEADYWKPIQCGTEGGTDLEKVRSLISNERSVLHPERYCFKEPASPHIASAKEMTKIKMEDFFLPETENNLIIEGAGGLLVPLNEDNYVIDLSRDLGAEVILVINNYLGCINHSLLSIDYLIKNDFELKGIVLNGNFPAEVKKAIINYAEVPLIAELPFVEEPTKEVIQNFKKYFAQSEL
ncbi:MAG TPA: dethiobiotin synthase [Bacteroidia bacterium]|jgi:dethiobiotin synthetase|nr:dethiobiotin synthase [Bacteroidia bacterium]